MNGRVVREQTVDQVCSALGTAMRADPDAIASLVESAGLDDFTAAFLREARSLALGLAAALNTVLGIHRHGRDPHDRDVCMSCGTAKCRTVRGVAEALSAYRVRFSGVDRAEAWRRAEGWFAHQAGRAVAVAVEEFDAGFIVRSAPGETVVVVDRRTGALTQWPDLPTGALSEHYRRYAQGSLG
ncbi:hypothetical protein GCM10022214_34290 [Actinomadura miaoliensis]|uniref:Tox-PL domain-containing protein n=1 Tax=Actinomadura miaoliensis TaxID=430685 RepID=A0ABP7VU78_9ACTN